MTHHAGPTKPLHHRTLRELPPGNHQDVGKGAIAGLYLRARPSGTLAWVIRYGHRGDRLTLGPADGRQGSLDLAAARRQAKTKIAEVQVEGGTKFRKTVEAGQKTVETERRAKAAEKLAPSFAVLATWLLAGARLRPSTRRAWESVVKVSILPYLGEKKPAEISTDDIEDCLNTVKVRSEWAADSAHKVLGWLFRLAIQKKKLTSSPMAGVVRKEYRFKEGGRRKTVATPANLKAVWNAAGSAGVYGSAVRLAMLTLCRRGEIFETRVSDIDLSDRTWRIPAERRKNGEAMTIPLTAPGLAIVRGLIESAAARDSRYLLPGKTIFLQPTSTAWDRLMTAAGFTRPEAEPAKKGQRREWRAHALRFHDLRRAGRTIMEQELSVPGSVAEAVLGHLPPGLIRTYNPSGAGLAECRRAAEKWSDYLMALVEGRAEGAGVVVTGQFRSGAA